MVRVNLNDEEWAFLCNLLADTYNDLLLDSDFAYESEKIAICLEKIRLAGFKPFKL